MKETLDPLQQQAIQHNQGPMLVWAGAGTGKTFVLVERIARLVRERVVPAEEILAIAYNDKAVDEIQGRVSATGSSAESKNPRVSTFHAYCLGILQRNQLSFDVLDENDLWIYLRRRIADLPLKYFIKAANLGEFLHDLINFFSRCHDELITPGQYLAYLARAEKENLPLPRVAKPADAENLPRAEALARCYEIAQSFQTVESMLAADGLGTFGHMITRALHLLESDERLLRLERARARFILVDEFQDANLAQIHLCRLLAGDEKNVFAVGDPDQAIYRFRGASNAAFDQFLRTFPAAATLRLERNHRSTTPILNCAYAVIAHNPELANAGSSLLRQRLISARDASNNSASEPCVIGITPSAEAEAAHIADSIENACRQEHCSWRDFAVLYRTHIHRDLVVRELAERDIPFCVTGMDIVRSPEFRDLRACLRVVADPSDAVALLRLAALPQFQILPQHFRAALRQNKILSALAELPSAKKLLSKIQELKNLAQASAMRALSVFQAAIACFGFSPDDPAVLGMKKFIAVWEEKPLTHDRSVNDFLEYLDLFLQAGGRATVNFGEGGDAVQLMTVHAAKGLEFRHVHVLRASSGSFPKNFTPPLFEFPHQLHPAETLSQPEGKEAHDQEERRLFYVAMTRARDTLALLAKPGRRKNDPTPSGFLRDLIASPIAKGFWRERKVAESTIALHAEAETMPPVAEWVSAPIEAAAAAPELSATAIEMYKRCPLQYKLCREWQLPQEPSAALHFGAAMHTALKLFGDRVAAGFSVTAEELVNCFAENFTAAPIDDPLQRTLYSELGAKQLRTFFAAQPAAALQVIASEKTFSLPIAGTQIRGRIDRIDRIAANRVSVIDYKTGSPKSQERADESLQLSLYALAARDQLGFVPERLLFFNLENGGEICTTRSDEELQQVIAEVRAVAQGVAAHEFSPTPGRHCSWCAYQQVCPTQEEKLYVIHPVAAAAGKVK